LETCGNAQVFEWNLGKSQDSCSQGSDECDKEIRGRRVANAAHEENRTARNPGGHSPGFRNPAAVSAANASPDQTLRLEN